MQPELKDQDIRKRAQLKNFVGISLLTGHDHHSFLNKQIENVEFKIQARDTRDVQPIDHNK